MAVYDRELLNLTVEIDNGAVEVWGSPGSQRCLWATKPVEPVSPLAVVPHEVVNAEA